MSAERIDGKAYAAGLRQRLAAAVPAFERATGRVPGLAVVLVGEDPASAVYVRSKGKATVEAGMASFEHKLPADTSEADLLALVDQLNRDATVDGILVQLPLPRQIDEQRVIAAIDPDKDVDGFHVANAGRLAVGQPGFVPCTPLGCLMLLQDRLGDLSGMEAVVIGRSNIVGKPMAQLLLGANCTVTIAHSRTRDLPAVVRRADIVVAAVGRPEMVKGDWLKPGAVVIDVGINRVPAAEEGKTRLVGDVDYASAAEVASAITPVPGGVGPMTIAVLLRNTLVAAFRRAGLAAPEGL
ncbi:MULTISPECIES: bifunctional methylenetetrahydrofolate dehydrogenase/methenyltetrahydrofolate cyclohydrolase FolD [Sphingomonadales]|uniref:Bifunctional protein FolD n=2 Tax=Edaphosphingomonas TaxID=3423724 RepID=A0A2T4HJS2_9SPHN|nr:MULTISPECIES: bifunctional methylenetetrahydrofolate dehydrogenase/methenyltetrahydrofolate cyclohydrolase FolD [Sphingomonas]AGH49376.1 bifunctional 5,10-methylene-tetrahydrofolate dehydrogenase/ 5,10-methylene-tetrahydrofolate cyclohydrolase [Sphingomonas sp. MM-1]OHT22013.1 Bifunctional protein FolD protein [Sphingomonas haloaromaticamans]PTD16052.1 bifunctional methylenetetrahydrofolate dehydrogenase/methenyltetrahydrofolate cyclohydrolase FolD [Sphingomonas fennica]